MRGTRLNSSKDVKVKFETESGLLDLYILKSTGSSFQDFWRDENTTLPDAADRIFSTTVECKYKFPDTVEVVSKQGPLASSIPYDSIFNGTRQIVLDIFANHDSPSVQNTLYRMGELVLDRFKDVQEISFALPNKHVFRFDLERFGMKNTGKMGEVCTVLYPVSAPSGLITATLGRRKAKL